MSVTLGAGSKKIMNLTENLEREFSRTSGRKTTHRRIDVAWMALWRGVYKQDVKGDRRTAPLPDYLVVLSEYATKALHEALRTYFGCPSQNTFRKPCRRINHRIVKNSLYFSIKSSIITL